MTPIWIMTIILAVTGEPDVTTFREYPSKQECFKALQQMGPTAETLLGDRPGIVTARCDPQKPSI